MVEEDSEPDAGAVLDEHDPEYFPSEWDISFNR